MIIERPAEAKKLNETRKWVLLYGRRKTGKSFLAENFVDYADYFFIKKDRSIVSKKTGRTVSYETFLEILKRELGGGSTVVVDEFHRLGDDFLDELHMAKKEGKLILISSTLYLSRKLVGMHSPLLGFVAEMPLGLIGFRDCLRALAGTAAGKKEMVEQAVFLREPIAADYFRASEKPSAQFASLLLASAKTVPALIGEIFSEEERSASAVYEGVLRAVASGRVVSPEITSYLFSRGLIKKDDPGLSSQYLKNLIEFGVIKRVRVFGKNRFVYKHVSPLARLFYYADEKYNISEREAGKEEILRIVGELLPRIVEDEVRALAAERFGLEEAVAEGKDFDVDGCLLRFKKPKMTIEVKWKEKISAEDVEKAQKNLRNIRAEEKWLFVPDKKMVSLKLPDWLRLVDIGDLQ